MGLFKQSNRASILQVEQLETLNTDLTQELEALRTEHNTALEDVLTMTEDLKVANDAIVAKDAEIETLVNANADLIDTQIDTSAEVAKQTAEVVADAGLEEPLEEVAETNTSTVLDTFEALPAGEQLAFYKQNKEEILKFSLIKK